MALVQVEPVEKVEKSVSGQSRSGSRRETFLGYVRAELFPILPLDGLHLIFEPQFEFLQTDLFQLFVLTEITLLGEQIKTFRVLRVLLSQSAELLVIGQELVSRS